MADPIFAPPPPKLKEPIAKEGPSQTTRERLLLQLLAEARKHAGRGWALHPGYTPADYLAALPVAYQMLTGEMPQGDPVRVQRIVQEIIGKQGETEALARYHIKVFKDWYEHIRDEGVL